MSPWRHREWNPALRAAGLEHRTVYAMRHTYASLSIAAGVSLFELSRLMGTSPAMLDNALELSVRNVQRPNERVERPRSAR